MINDHARKIFLIYHFLSRKCCTVKYCAPWRKHRGRETVTSVLNKISTDQLRNSSVRMKGGGVPPPAPKPFYCTAAWRQKFKDGVNGISSTSDICFKIEGFLIYTNIPPPPRKDLVNKRVSTWTNSFLFRFAIFCLLSIWSWISRTWWLLLRSRQWLRPL